jgi:hypothetical protein
VRVRVSCRCQRHVLCSAVCGWLTRASSCQVCFPATQAVRAFRMCDCERYSLEKGRGACVRVVCQCLLCAAVCGWLSVASSCQVCSPAARPRAVRTFHKCGCECYAAAAYSLAGARGFTYRPRQAWAWGGAGSGLRIYLSSSKVGLFFGTGTTPCYKFDLLWADIQVLVCVLEHGVRHAGASHSNGWTASVAGGDSLG